MTIDEAVAKKMGELTLTITRLEVLLAEETAKREEAERNLEAAKAQIDAMNGSNIEPIRKDDAA